MMINTFKSYLQEQDSIGYLAFGRFNPPTIGHEKLLDTIASKARGNAYKIFSSQSQDSKKNPLDYQTKVKFMRKMFPKHARNIIMDKSVKNFLDAAVHMHNKGYKNLVMVAGSDRVKEFETLLKKYNGVESRHGLFDFNSVNVISAGERDPDAEGATGMSASKMRAAASDNDFPKFLMGLPKGVTDNLAKDLFNSVRKGMDLKENRSFTQHIMLSPVSERREDYVAGGLFSVGSMVIVKETDQKAVISYCGSNYLIIEIDGKRQRKWLTDVEPLEEKLEVTQDPDIRKRKGSQPATFFRGIKTKSTKTKRDTHFRKMAKKKDDDPSAYKPAPGDVTAKTKESPYTKRFKQLYGESYD